MPSIAAAIVASLAGWTTDSIIGPYAGAGARIFTSIVVSTAVYVYARRWLLELRGR